MIHIKKICFWVGLALAFSAGNMVYAQDEFDFEDWDGVINDGNYTYIVDLKKGTAYVTAFAPYDNHKHAPVEKIPSQVSFANKTFKVTSIIGEYIYGIEAVMSVGLPSSITYINNDAFANVYNVNYKGRYKKGAPWGAWYINRYVEGDCLYCDSSKTILLACMSKDSCFVVPSSVTYIAIEAFVRSDVKVLKLPSSVQQIEEDALGGIYNVEYAGPALQHEEKQWGCRCLNGYVEGYLVYSDSTKRELVACMNNAVGSVDLSPNTQRIARKAFLYCSHITTVTFPENITIIEPDAFAGCTNNMVSAYWNVKHCADFKAGNSPLFLHKEHYGYDPKYVNYSKINNVIFGSTVERIPAQLCYHMQQLTAITIPDNVKSIGTSAFLECNALKTVTIGNGLTMVESSAFQSCEQLEVVVIGKGITQIDNLAFAYCDQLQSVTIYASQPPTLGDYVFFQRGEGPLTIYVPQESVELYKSAPGWKDYKNIVGIPQ